MPSTSTDRWLPALGLAYPLLTVAAFVAFPAPPGGDVSAVHDHLWLASHLGPVTAQAMLRSLAALGFAVLTVAVSVWLSRRWARLVVAAGLATTMLLLTAQTAVLAAATLVRAGSSADLSALDGLNAAALDLSSLPAVLVFGLTAAGFLTTGRGSRGAGLLSLVGVPLALLDSLSYDGGPLAWFGLIGLAYFLIWSLLVTAFLIWRPSPVEPPQAAVVRSGTGLSTARRQT